MATAIKRGCGVRVQNGVYVCTPTSKNGRPIEEFLIDAPTILNPALGVSPIGVTLIEMNGVTHVIDYVGANSYPNVADFIEETRRFGLSRRVAATLDFSKLTPRSRWIGVHARAHIANPERYWTALEDDGTRACPRRLSEHSGSTPPPMCIQLVYHDVDGGRPADDATRAVWRDMPSFSYLAHRRPEFAEPLYAPAIFISLPLKKIEVIRGTSGLHETNAAKASASGLPVSIEQE